MRLRRFFLALAVAFLAAAPALADQRTAIFIGGTSFAGGRYSAASTSYYLAPGGSPDDTNTVQANAEVIWRGPGTLSNFYFDPIGNARTTDTTISVLKNGTPLFTRTWVAGVASQQIETGSYSVADGDAITLRITLGTGTGNFTLGPVSWQFTTTTTQASSYLTSWIVAPASTAAARFSNFGAGLAAGSTETVAQLSSLESATLSNFNVLVTANANASGTLTVVSRKNAANGGQSVGFVGAATGLLEDTVGSDLIAADDLFDLFKPASTGAVSLKRGGVRYTSQNPGVSPLVITPSGAVTSGAVQWTAPGAAIFGDTTQGNQLWYAPFDAHLTGLRVYVTSYAGANDLKIGVWVAGSEVRTLTIPAASSFPGYFTDSGINVAITAGQSMQFKIYNQNATATYNSIFALLTDDNATPLSAAAGASTLLTLGVGQ